MCRPFRPKIRGITQDPGLRHMLVCYALSGLAWPLKESYSMNTQAFSPLTDRSISVIVFLILPAFSSVCFHNGHSPTIHIRKRDPDFHKPGSLWMATR